jgi:hypothetical protein
VDHRLPRRTAAARRPRRWFHRQRQPDGRRWLSFARYPGGYLLRFIGLADFDVRPAARQIHGYRTPVTPPHTFNHLLLDQVLPLAAGGPHRLALHASVVDVDGRAVAFLGASRQGKSTLAAALARRGHTLLSDDCCAAERLPASTSSRRIPGCACSPRRCNVFSESWRNRRRRSRTTRGSSASCRTAPADHSAIDACRWVRFT